MTLFPDTAKPAKKPSTRRENDRYLTPPMATSALMQAFPEIEGGLLLDPCAGDLRMSAQIQPGRFSQARTNDIDATSPAQTHMDATSAEAWGYWKQKRHGVWGPHPCWCVTNPPFGRASAIAWQALEAGFHLALLLRITWLEPTADRQWLARRPPTAQLVLPRIDFIGAGKADGATCCWFIWGPVKPGIQILRASDVGQTELFG